jgi:hypothetical protein
VFAVGFEKERAGGGAQLAGLRETDNGGPRPGSVVGVSEPAPSRFTVRMQLIDFVQNSSRCRGVVRDCPLRFVAASATTRSPLPT